MKKASVLINYVLLSLICHIGIAHAEVPDQRARMQQFEGQFERCDSDLLDRFRPGSPHRSDNPEQYWGTHGDCRQAVLEQVAGLEWSEKQAIEKAEFLFRKSRADLGRYIQRARKEANRTIYRAQLEKLASLENTFQNNKEQALLKAKRSVGIDSPPGALKVRIDPKIEDFQITSGGKSYRWQHIFDFYNKDHAVTFSLRPYLAEAFYYTTFKDDAGDIYVASIVSKDHNIYKIDPHTDYFSIRKLPIDSVINEVTEKQGLLLSSNHVVRAEARKAVGDKYPAYALLADHFDGNDQPLWRMKDGQPDFHLTYSSYKKSYEKYASQGKLTYPSPFGDVALPNGQDQNYFADRSNSRPFSFVDLSDTLAAKGYAAEVSDKECIDGRFIRITVPNANVLKAVPREFRSTLRSAISEGCKRGPQNSVKSVQIFTSDGVLVGDFKQVSRVLIPTSELNESGSLLILPVDLGEVDSLSVNADLYASLYHLLAYEDFSSLALFSAYEDMRPELYSAFAWAYAKQCRKHLPGVDRINETIIKKSGFGNVISERNNTYEVEAGQGAIMIGILERYSSGFSQLTAQATVREFIAKYGCDGKEVQSIRRASYQIGRRL